MTCALALALALAATTPAPDVYEINASPPPKFKVSSCKLEAKPGTGEAASAAVVHYDVSTNEAGVVTSVAEVGASGSPPPLRPVFGSVERCLKSWKLEPNTTYDAELHWGSGLPKPTWQVCRTSGGCVELTEAP
jgi:hypothetical protein